MLFPTNLSVSNEEIKPITTKQPFVSNIMI